jgi:hypothetical protein
VDPAIFSEAEKLSTSGRLGELFATGGGASSTVYDDGESVHRVWVGVVSGAFSAECDCAEAAADPDELCVHAVAVTISALEGEFAWSSAATPPSGVVVDQRVRELTEVAATLSVRRLAALVGERAAVDRRLEARLLTYAGRLGAPTDEELTAVREIIDDLSTEATSDEFELHHVVRAGHLIIDELEVLAQRPATDGVLDTVEHAAEVWDELVAHLPYSWGPEDEPEEIGGAIRAVHVLICTDLQVDAENLVDRLIGIIISAENTSCLDVPEDYLALLGPDGVEAVHNRL